jgi:hypothetical protein
MIIYYQLSNKVAGPAIPLVLANLPKKRGLMKKATRIIIKLACGEHDCRHFYVTTKNKANNPER